MTKIKNLLIMGSWQELEALAHIDENKIAIHLKTFEQCYHVILNCKTDYRLRDIAIWRATSRIKTFKQAMTLLGLTNSDYEFRCKILKRAIALASLSIECHELFKADESCKKIAVAKASKAPYMFIRDCNWVCNKCDEYGFEFKKVALKRANNHLTSFLECKDVFEEPLFNQSIKDLALREAKKLYASFDDFYWIYKNTKGPEKFETYRKLGRIFAVTIDNWKWLYDHAPNNLYEEQSLLKISTMAKTYDDLTWLIRQAKDEKIVSKAELDLKKILWQ